MTRPNTLQLNYRRPEGIPSGQGLHVWTKYLKACDPSQNGGFALIGDFGKRPSQRKLNDQEEIWLVPYDPNGITVVAVNWELDAKARTRHRGAAFVVVPYLSGVVSLPHSAALSSVFTSTDGLSLDADVLDIVAFREGEVHTGLVDKIANQSFRVPPLNAAIPQFATSQHNANSLWWAGLWAAENYPHSVAMQVDPNRAIPVNHYRRSDELTNLFPTEVVAKLGEWRACAQIAGILLFEHVQTGQLALLDAVLAENNEPAAAALAAEQAAWFEALAASLKIIADI